MNKEVFNKLDIALEDKVKVALVTITKASGSAPSSVGQNMLVYETGEIVGTVGGGNVEASIIQNAKDYIIAETNMSFNYQLSDLGMTCGGSVEGFIQVPRNYNKLVIIGGGHIGRKLYELTKVLDFNITIVDDRETFANNERFPGVKTISGDISKILTEIEIDPDTYIVIVSKGHLTDYDALISVVKKSPKYLGLIGSKRKINELYKKLREENIEEKDINAIYGPIGLNIAKEDPSEIAISILSEILLVKNQGSLNHMKDLV